MLKERSISANRTDQECPAKDGTFRCLRVGRRRSGEGGTRCRIAGCAQHVRLPAGLTVILDSAPHLSCAGQPVCNALEAMAEGGEIHIAVISEGHSISIRVRDSGTGIAPEIRDRLFQPFATAGKANGVGLGLALSRQAVRDHRGRNVGRAVSRRSLFLRSIAVGSKANDELDWPGLSAEWRFPMKQSFPHNGCVPTGFRPPVILSVCGGGVCESVS